MEKNYHRGRRGHREADATHCIRCGACCRSGSPSLHPQDLDKIVEGKIGAEHLYTLRRGEVVRDNVRGGLTVLRSERIKIRERVTGPCPGACCYFDPTGNACGIYENRPSQCAALACWDTSVFMEIYEGPGLTRRDLIRDEGALTLMEEHEERCDYARIERIVKRLSVDGDSAARELVDAIQYDHRVRQAAVHELGRSPGESDLLFGRALIHNLPVFGLEAETRPDGSLRLRRLR